MMAKFKMKLSSKVAESSIRRNNYDSQIRQNNFTLPGNCIILIIIAFAWLALFSQQTITTHQQSFITSQQDSQQQQQQQQQIVSLSIEQTLAAVAALPPVLGPPREPVVPPPEQRPQVRVNIRDWTRRLSEEIRLVANRTSCTHKIAQFYSGNGAQFQKIDAAKLRDTVLIQINSLLGQHRAAVNAIVSEAEQLAGQHRYQKELRINYTDVHRLRNELESQQAQIEAEQALLDKQPTLNSGQSLMTGGQQTSITGGTPVPGPPEWQTPIRTLAMTVQKNFGDIPVNTSHSAVHLPLPIYAGLPNIMNGIAWTENLDKVFRKNLDLFAYVHHQVYGSHLGFLRTFPAHKWRIPRTEPDLFDARTRPWYIAGAATPKDVVILIDSSGSMTGLRREIARGVVFELLDTLTINDHFSVMRFAENLTPIGLPKCNNLRQPHLTPELEGECPAYHHPHQHSASSIAASSKQQQQHRHASLDSAGSTECTNFRRQWDNRGQYLHDHPDVLLGKNGSYLTDESYRRSILNVTNDIRDAYLLPATGRNIRYFKSNFTMPTAGIANFTHALMGAFELLQSYNRTNDMGSQCQQAIMLITDGAIRSHEDVFNRYNYPNSPVRVFTYMIGREVGNIRPTKEMACRNRGYYTHVINLSEVREQVQKYLPVMARPLVLAQQHPITWTNAYGDETYQVLTDWVLEIKRRERARIMLNEERERLNDANSSDVINIEMTGISEYDEMPLVDEQLKDRIICEDDPRVMEQSLEDELDPLGYNDLACHWTHTRRAELLTSVVKPVFDLKNTSLFYERILSNNIWTEKETRVRNAQLLGVAAVDLRVADIMRAIPSHLLGPNGYAILIGQNGFVMSHPDHRPLLEDPFDKLSKILKPHFNVVDLTHVEQVHHRAASTATNETGNEGGLRKSSRNDDIKLIKLREAAIRKAIGQETITVKRSIDCRRRPHVRQQMYFYGPIKETPFSLMIALPKSYGLNRVQAKLPLTKTTQQHFSPSEYDLFTIHPEYKYCEPKGLSASAPVASQNDSLQTLLELFKLAAEEEPMATEQSVELGDLNAISEQISTGLSSGPIATGSRSRSSKQNKQPGNGPRKFICDKELFPSLLFDARATHEPSSGGSIYCCPNANNYFYGDDSSPSCSSSPEEMRSKLAAIYGLEMSFVATRSGLTRARVFELNTRVKKLAALFIERHSRAVDESWYARTVDWNMRSSDTQSSTVISVPNNAYIRLIVKLRLRITQRHPVAANDSRTNCDPSLYEDEEPLVQTSDPSSTAPISAKDEQMATTTHEMLQQQSSPAASQVQNDEPQVSSGESSSADVPSPEQASSEPSQPGPALAEINYSNYSSFDFLDLLSNSSVHIAATQTIVASQPQPASSSGGEQRSPVGVTGHLYDYATFARRFLNTTSLSIRTLELDQEDNTNQVKVQICPNGECPTRCGNRTDTIDCLLVDNNGYIIVGEELPHIGRSLADYDDKLMASLVERRVFQQISLTDYQAICARNDQAEIAARQAAAAQAQAQANAQSAAASMAAANSMASTSSSSAASSNSQLSTHGQRTTLTLELASRVLANFASALIYASTTIYSAFFMRSAITPDELLQTSDPNSWLGQLYQWQRSTLMSVDAQSAIANQSLLALLPNKTYLRPCEKQVILYDMRPPSQANSQQQADGKPEYFETRCGCSGWYVYDHVPETNLIMLLVNSSASCRLCEPSVPVSLVPSTLAPAISPLIDTTLLPPANQPLPAQQQQAVTTTPMPRQDSAVGWTPPARTLAEDQVCAMLERDAQLYTARPPACMSSHPEEAQIHLCGAADQLELPKWLILLATSLLTLLCHNYRSAIRSYI